jgi:hypothetical protein
MMSTDRHGHNLGKHSKIIDCTRFLPWIFSRYLAPSFLTSLGAVGFVGYALAQTRAIPSSSNISLFHLIGVAGELFYLVHNK